MESGWMDLGLGAGVEARRNGEYVEVRKIVRDPHYFPVDFYSTDAWRVYCPPEFLYLAE